MTSLGECRKQFPDDPEIADEVRLLRRIPPWHFVPDGNDGSYRPSSAAFEDDDDGDPMSVYRADVIEAESGQLSRVMIHHKEFGLVSIAAGSVRQKNQTVHPDCLPEETFAHPSLWGEVESDAEVVCPEVQMGHPPAAMACRHARIFWTPLLGLTVDAGLYEPH